MKQLSFLLLLIFAVSACKSVDKLYEAGDYEQIISKLEGKAKRNSLDRKERNMLIKAANKYFETEESKIMASTNSDNFRDWKDARQKLKRLLKESDKITDYPQVRIDEIDASGLEGLAIEVDQKLFDFTWDLYDEGIAQYNDTADREYVIRAARYVNDLGKYGASDVLMDSLYQETIVLAHRFIAVSFDSDVFNNWEFRNNFRNEINLRDDDYNTFTDRIGPETDYELVIAAEIRNTDERTDEDYQEYTEEVVDYYETEIDTSTNKEIKTPVYKTISATVKEVEYTWTVEGRWQFEIYDVKANVRFDRGSFSEAVQDQAYLYFLESGDDDAVPSSIDLETFSFPRYDFENLIEECFEELADSFDGNIRLNSRLK